jgi:hypothetical protein
MHEKNDAVTHNEEEISLSSKAKEIQHQRHLTEERGLDSRNTPTIRDDAETVYSLDSDPNGDTHEEHKDW